MMLLKVNSSAFLSLACCYTYGKGENKMVIQDMSLCQGGTVDMFTSFFSYNYE